MRRAGHVLDVCDGVVAVARGRAGMKIDRDAGRGGGVTERVGSGPAVKQVIAAAADKGVVVGRARGVFDIGQGIAAVAGHDDVVIAVAGQCVGIG